MWIRWIRIRNTSRDNIKETTFVLNLLCAGAHGGRAHWSPWAPSTWRRTSWRTLKRAPGSSAPTPATSTRSWWTRTGRTPTSRSWTRWRTRNMIPPGCQPSGSTHRLVYMLPVDQMSVKTPDPKCRLFIKVVQLRDLAAVGSCLRPPTLVWDGKAIV